MDDKILLTGIALIVDSPWITVTRSSHLIILINMDILYKHKGPSWSWLYGSWITTTYTISAYYHWSFEFESCSSEVYSI